MQGLGLKLVRRRVNYDKTSADDNEEDDDNDESDSRFAPKQFEPLRRQSELQQTTTTTMPRIEAGFMQGIYSWKLVV